MRTVEPAAKSSGIGRLHESAFLRVAAVILACQAASGTSQAPDPPAWTNALDRVLALAPVYSATRRFAAVGMEPGLKQDVLSWAEDVASRLEKMVSQPLHFDNRELRIVLRRDEGRTNGLVSADETLDGRRLLQRLTITNYERADMEAVMAHLCGLLLAGQVYAAATNGVAPWNPSQIKRSAPLPHWLACGMAQNIYPSLRARNSRLLLDAWRAGKAPSSSAILAAIESPSAASGAPPGNGRPDRCAEAGCGMFVAWILSTPNRDEVMESILRRLSTGDPIDREWLTPQLLRGSHTESLNDGWDLWILQQKRTISVPGGIPVEALDQLAAELLLYPGLSGIPSGAREGQVLSFDFLIAERRATWVGPLARTRQDRLQLLKIGRDARYQAAVDAYCRFLDGIIEKASERRLRRLLDEARRLQATVPRPPRQTPQMAGAGSNRLERRAQDEEP